MALGFDLENRLPRFVVHARGAWVAGQPQTAPPLGGCHAYGMGRVTRRRYGTLIGGFSESGTQPGGKEGG